MAGLRSEAQIREALSRSLQRSFAEVAAGTCDEWPLRMPLGRPSRQDLLDGLPELQALTLALRRWETDLGCTTDYAMREAGGPKRVPTHLTVPTADVAARIATTRKGEPWTLILKRTRKRAHVVRAEFPQLAADDVAHVLRSLDAADDLEFELVMSAGSWFQTHDARGLTPRQVPIGGIDAKWLNNKRRQDLLCLLSGKGDLGLAGRAASVEFAYLDPTHLAADGRHYDSWVDGDVARPAYEPRTVLIVENKDTYLCFPQHEGGICVFGSGFAGPALVTRLPWVREATDIVYWGDLDADGFEILNAYRAAGLACRSILMDEATLERFGRFGTSVEKDHRTPIERPRKDLPHLRGAERRAYELLTDPDYEGHRRLEQERIPLTEAAALL